MVGIIPLIILGRIFYKLAQEYNKSDWGYAILAVITYLITMFGSALALAFVKIVQSGGIDAEVIAKDNEMLINILSTIVGVVCCIILYYFLKNRWQKEEANTIDEIYKIGSNDSDENHSVNP